MGVESIDLEYLIYLGLWVALPTLMFLLHSRRGGIGGFLVYSYLLVFLVAHWFGALAHASPWATFVDPTDTIIGFRYSTYALIALCVGASLIEIARPPRHYSIDDAKSAERQATLEELDQLGRRLFLPIGILSWICTYTPLTDLPSASAVLSVGKQCLVLAICLLCWSSWYRGQRSRFTGWLAASALLPVVTVVSAGFIGYGIVMVTTILSFVAMFYRPRRVLLIGLLAMLYCGVSLWITYAEHRNEIRASVWGGESAATSFNKVLEVFWGIRPFDYSNPEHLDALDLRLNQNSLVGAAIRNTPTLVAFREGETIYAALAAVIPRAIWPDKPVGAGSGTYVSQHTLIPFAEGTSVGMGQVLELYINFGTAGIVIGFIVLGALLRYMDVLLVEALTRNDWRFVMLMFLVGSGMLQAGGSLAEISASSASGWVVATALAHILRWYRRHSATVAQRRLKTYR